ncbi:hypothetical protein CP977_26125 [Streptomyces cinereoruber]|uniref:Uncharacterized protein n=1 Tax=Streptomyces cinereoruber TaxID=67260 RepID=A0ABX6BIU0_9ACTN|nr:hypothetical protein CP977_26125 [Streptomyces cinereoruber]
MWARRAMPNSRNAAGGSSHPRARVPRRTGTYERRRPSAPRTHRNTAAAAIPSIAAASQSPPGRMNRAPYAK